MANTAKQKRFSSIKEWRLQQASFVQKKKTICSFNFSFFRKNEKKAATKYSHRPCFFFAKRLFVFFFKLVLGCFVVSWSVAAFLLCVSEFLRCLVLCLAYVSRARASARLSVRICKPVPLCVRKSLLWMSTWNLARSVHWDWSADCNAHLSSDVPFVAARFLESVPLDMCSPLLPVLSSLFIILSPAPPPYIYIFICIFFFVYIYKIYIYKPAPSRL